MHIILKPNTTLIIEPVKYFTFEQNENKTKKLAMSFPLPIATSNC